MNHALREMARKGYEAYGAARDGKAYDGSPIPAWDELDDGIQAAWVHAAFTIVSAAAQHVPAAVRRLAVTPAQGSRTVMTGGLNGDML